MRKLRFRKWVKCVIVAMIIIVSIITAHFICAKLRNLNKTIELCDNQRGHICTYYEIRQNMIGNK